MLYRLCSILNVCTLWLVSLSFLQVHEVVAQTKIADYRDTESLIAALAVDGWGKLYEQVTDDAEKGSEIAVEVLYKAQKKMLADNDGTKRGQMNAVRTSMFSSIGFGGKSQRRKEILMEEICNPTSYWTVREAVEKIGRQTLLPEDIERLRKRAPVIDVEVAGKIQEWIVIPPWKDETFAPEDSYPARNMSGPRIEDQAWEKLWDFWTTEPRLEKTRNWLPATRQYFNALNVQSNLENMIINFDYLDQRGVNAFWRRIHSFCLRMIERNEKERPASFKGIVVAEIDMSKSIKHPVIAPFRKMVWESLDDEKTLALFQALATPTWEEFEGMLARTKDALIKIVRESHLTTQREKHDAENAQNRARAETEAREDQTPDRVVEFGEPLLKVYAEAAGEDGYEQVLIIMREWDPAAPPLKRPDDILRRTKSPKCVGGLIEIFKKHIHEYDPSDPSSEIHLQSAADALQSAKMFLNANLRQEEWIWHRDEIKPFTRLLAQTAQDRSLPISLRDAAFKCVRDLKSGNMQEYARGYPELSQAFDELRSESENWPLVVADRKQKLRLENMELDRIFKTYN